MTPKHCPTCGTPLVRDEKHDAYYCARCNVWIESRCDDPKCEFCATRPATPAPV